MAGTPIFESQTCTRCGGSGRYSWCQMWGDRCFKCHGRGYTLTKRGQAAQDFYQRISSLPAKDLKPGMVIWTSVGLLTEGWSEVISVEDNAIARSHASIVNGEHIYAGMNITTKHCAECMVPSDKLVRVRHTKEERIANTTKALEYQATLTKTGTVRKVKAK